MKKINIGNISNLMVIDSEEDYEFEGICGTGNGVLWEDSLEQFFDANGIEVLDGRENEYVILKQGDLVVKFETFLGNEGSTYESEHIDFGSRMQLEGFEKTRDGIVHKHLEDAYRWLWGAFRNLEVQDQDGQFNHAVPLELRNAIDKVEGMLKSIKETVFE